MKDTWLVTIGLEVHVQLKTQTKIFCGCPVRFASAPNSNVCPVCLGLPGVLPVLNKEVFRLGLRAVLALGGAPSALIRFDRKNYFYPDLPKGYQISQFIHPLGVGGLIEIGAPAKGGSAAISGGKTIRINRLHLEEDAGKLIHDQSDDSSYVDLNRAGTPLAEIVSEPDLESPDEAYEYLTALKAILKSIGVSECDMEKGQLRCDANVSLRKNPKDPLGKKVEIKNLNSFKAVKASLLYEIARQGEALDQGESLSQETRLWDDARQKTFSMRSKEEAHDYRYFPEPDLVPFSVAQSQIDEARVSIPELPKAKKERFMKDFGLSDYDASVLTGDIDLALFFEKCSINYKSFKKLSNWLTGPMLAYINESPSSNEFSDFTANGLIKIMKLVDDGVLSFQTAKEKVFAQMLRDKKDPETIIKAEGLEQVSDDSALERWVAEALSENPKVVADFKSGKESSAMFLVGQVMRKSQGKAHPQKVQDFVRKKLKE